jgi:hypothetical protein
MIYVKQIKDSWTLCDDRGRCVHNDGSLAYHPDFFTDRPQGYPLYENVAEQGKRSLRRLR